jgi:hypothetical protein
MRAIVGVCAFLLCQGAAAQPFKCTDAKGKVTYTSTKCSDLGLKDAGTVQDRVQVTPAYQPPARTSPPRDQEEPRAKPAAAAEPEKKPERRCFTTNVKGKSVTRCNDKPDEE